MEHLEEQDVTRLKELLRRTGEFIAYFELVETKMVEWRQEIEHQSTSQHHQFQQELQALQTELSTVEELFTQTGLARFRIAAEQALNQGKDILLSMQRLEQQLLKNMSAHQRDITQLSEQLLSQISAHTTQAIEQIDAKLARYDINDFHQTAMDSCAKIEKTSTDIIAKSSNLLRLSRWRSLAMILLTTIITSFGIGLYLSGEYPWEVHKHALNERDAGKMLMKIWPKLTYQEKNKILREHAHAQG